MLILETPNELSLGQKAGLKQKLICENSKKNATKHIGFPTSVSSKYPNPGRRDILHTSCTVHKTLLSIYSHKLTIQVSICTVKKLSLFASILL